MVSLETSRRNWARGLRAPLKWFLAEMVASTSVICSWSTPYLAA